MPVVLKIIREGRFLGPKSIQCIFQRVRVVQHINHTGAFLNWMFVLARKKDQQEKTFILDEYFPRERGVSNLSCWLHPFISNTNWFRRLCVRQFVKLMFHIKEL